MSIPTNITKHTLLFDRKLVWIRINKLKEKLNFAIKNWPSYKSIFRLYDMDICYFVKKIETENCLN